MKRSLLLILSLLYSMPAFALEPEWFGLRLGSCRHERGETMMSLAIGPADEGFDFIIRYHGEAPRNYLLRPHGEHYILDERNGILIDTFKTGNLLSNLFTVNGMVLSANYRLETNGRITVLINSFSAAPIRGSGAGANAVQSFGLIGVQECDLLPQPS